MEGGCAKSVSKRAKVRISSSKYRKPKLMHAKWHRKSPLLTALPLHSICFSLILPFFGKLWQRRAGKGKNRLYQQYLGNSEAKMPQKLPKQSINAKKYQKTEVNL